MSEVQTLMEISVCQVGALLMLGIEQKNSIRKKRKRGHIQTGSSIFYNR